MKVLIVGEGKHETGAGGFGGRPIPAAGFLFILVRKVCSEIDTDGLALTWASLNLLQKKEPGKKFDSTKGLAKKVQYAITQARRNECQGTICVHDRDGDDDRLSEMEKGRQAEISKQNDGHQAVCALAVESIEAWLLGAPTAIAAVVQADLNTIQKHVKEYTPSRVEELKETSEKEEKQPKKMLDKIAQLNHRSANTAFREEVASQMDDHSLSELKANCPNGFKPFAEKLLAAFGPRPAP